MVCTIFISIGGGVGMDFFVYVDCKGRQFPVIIEGGVLGWILFAAGIESLCKD